MIDRQLILHTIGHFSVDAVCAAVIYRHISDLSNASALNETHILIMILAYNLLAFATQPIAGFLFDKKPLTTKYVSWSFVFLMAAVLPFLNIWIKISLLGIGNSMFHTAAGSIVIKKTPGKASPLGIFVSSGAVGLTVGTVFGDKAATIPILLVLLFAMFALSFELPDTTTLQRIKPPPRVNIKAALCLSVCIAIRSLFGFLPVTQFQKTIAVNFLIVAGVFAGKFIGGILADKFTIKKTVVVSLLSAAALFLPGIGSPAFWSATQLFINMSMPVTLFLMCKAMPGRPGLAFGWAAACLLPGLLAPAERPAIPDYMYLSVLFVNIVLILFAFNEINKTDGATATNAPEKEPKETKD